MLAGALGAGELPPMSIPGISAGMLAVGAGELPDMSIPGISAGMLAVGAGAPPDMSIPGISAAILAVGAGVSDPTRPTAAPDEVAADDCWFEVSITEPMTTNAPTVAPTDPTRIQRRHGSEPDVAEVCSLWLLTSAVLLIVISVQPLRGTVRAWAAVTTPVFPLTIGSVPSDFPSDLYEGFVKFFRRLNRPAGVGPW
jgi:hypothetical protein